MQCLGPGELEIRRTARNVETIKLPLHSHLQVKPAAEAVMIGSFDGVQAQCDTQKRHGKHDRHGLDLTDKLRGCVWQTIDWPRRGRGEQIIGHLWGEPVPVLVRKKECDRHNITVAKSETAFRRDTLACSLSAG